MTARCSRSPARDAVAAMSDVNLEAARHHGGYSSDSSVLSHDPHRGRPMNRLDRRTRWTSWSNLIYTSNESLSRYQQLPLQRRPTRMAITRSKSETRSRLSNEGQPRPYTCGVIDYIWVTEVNSGASFYAVTEEGREKAAEVRAALADLLGDSPNMADRVVPKMICALKVNGCWERVSVSSHCTLSSCMLRKSEQEQQPCPQEYWHVSLMEVGTTACAPLSQLALVTRAIATEPRSAKFYFLRRIHIKEEKNSAQAKEHLKSLIMNDQRLTAAVFKSGSRTVQAEVVMGDTFLSDILVEAGFAEYLTVIKQDQREASKAGACCSSQDMLSVSSRDSLLPHETLPSSQSKMPVVANSTLAEMMELIGYLMKKRNESAYLTSSDSALNLAIKAQCKERLPHHLELCDCIYAALNKYQILMRKLRKENPHIHEMMDFSKESLYEQLVGMFEKWKASYEMAQKLTDDAIDDIANIFLSFTNQTAIFLKYKNKTKKLEASLNNEVLLQNEGQDLAQMIVPTVATKLMSFIEELETLARSLTHAVATPLTLLQFITNSKNITALTLDSLAKDILKGLYQYHVKEVAYKHLHPDNVLMINGHAILRSIDDQHEWKRGKDWPFEGVEVSNEALGKPGDVYNFGLLILWMACKGAEKYYTATMKFYCNMTLIKMIMADDSSLRPLVESMVFTKIPIFRSDSQWRSIPLGDYLREVFDDRSATEVEEESCDQPSEMETETGEPTSESEVLYQPDTEEESGSETTASVVPKPPRLASMEREG